MRYRSSRIFGPVILSFLFLSPNSAQTVVRVDEHAARIQLLSNDATIDLPIENQSRDTLALHALDRKSVV